MVLIQTFEQGETLKKKDLFHHEVLFVNVDVIMEVARKKKTNYATSLNCWNQ